MIKCSSVKKIIGSLIPIILLVALILPTAMALASTGDVRIREYWDTGGDSSSGNCSSTIWYAQQFTTDNVSHTVTNIRLPLERVGDPDTLTVSIREADSGLPTGRDLASGTIDGGILSTSTYGWYEFTLGNELSLEGNTQYAVVLRAVAGNNTNYVLWEQDSGGGIANAVGSNSTNSGLTWTSETPADYLFEIWGCDLLAVKGVDVFSDYYEEGDMLFLVDMFNESEPYYPADDSGAYFDLVLLDTDNTTVLGSTPCVDWGRRAGSIYLSADSAASITWGDDYNVQLVGSYNPDYVIASYELQGEDWWGSNLAYLDKRVLRIAYLMETYYNTTFVTAVSGVEVLNDAGGMEMEKGIRGLSYIRPDLFQTLEHTPTYTPNEYTNAYEEATNWEDQVGSGVVDTMDAISDIFTIDGKNIIQGILLVGIIALPIITQSWILGVVVAMPIAYFGVWLRVFPIQVLSVMVAVCFILIMIKWWFSR